MAELKVGDMAPDFCGKTQNSETLSLAELKGGKTVLYFYPKDNTSGCTLEAKSLRDGKAALAERGYRIVGVAPKLLRQARAKLHTDSRHRPLDMRGIWRVG